MSSLFDTINKKLSAFIRSQLPSHIVSDYSKESGSGVSRFANFLEKYYEFLEDGSSDEGTISDYANDSIESLKNTKIAHLRKIKGNLYNRLILLKSLRDIDDTIHSTLQYLRSEFFTNVEYETSSDQKHTLKLIKDFYQTKGSGNAVEILFKLFYNKVASVSYPIENVTNISGSEWVKEKFVRATTVSGDSTTVSDFDSFIGNYIVGESSGAKAVVSSVEETIYNGIVSYEFVLENITGNFTEEVVYGQNSLGSNLSLSNGAKIRAQLRSAIEKVNVTASGNGYYPEETPTISNPGNGYGAKLKVHLTAGEIFDINISGAGGGYAVGNPLYFVNSYFVPYDITGTMAAGQTITGGTSGATGIIDSIDGSTPITRIWVRSVVGDFITDDSSQLGYGGETITLANGGTFKSTKIHTTGSVSAYAEVSSHGGSGNITGINLINPGKDYTFPPKIYAATSGSVASLKPYGDNVGGISKIEVLDNGINYASYASIGVTSQSSPYTSSSVSLSISPLCSRDKYRDTVNKVGSTSVIRNSEYYGEYSYVVDVDLIASEWSGVLEKLVHPAGMKYFGNINLIETPTLSMTSTGSGLS